MIHDVHVNMRFKKQNNDAMLIKFSSHNSNFPFHCLKNVRPNCCIYQNNVLHMKSNNNDDDDHNNNLAVFSNVLHVTFRLVNSYIRFRRGVNIHIRKHVIKLN